MHKQMVSYSLFVGVYKVVVLSDFLQFLIFLLNFLFVILFYLFAFFYHIFKSVLLFRSCVLKLFTKKNSNNYNTRYIVQMCIQIKYS